MLIVDKKMSPNVKASRSLVTRSMYRSRQISTCLVVEQIFHW